MTPDPEGELSYFSKRRKIHPRIVHGRFARLRVVALYLTLGVLYLLPWLRWGDRPAFLLDLPRRKFYLFGLVLWPQDLIYLTALLVLAALALFLFTALAGRVWCGYACPQTVFTQILVWIERAVEGDRAAQVRLRARGHRAELAWKRALKWTLWTLVAAWTAFSAVGFFTPVRELGTGLLAGSSGRWEAFFLVLFTASILLFAGFLREQVCIYMCPYARFQSAMFDRDTLVVSYDGSRGEPRGARSRTDDPKARGLGDCVSCTLCVQACPTGIDIRDGLQYQCIACTACIDACDGVMDRLGYARGLIRYTTQNSIEGRRTRFLRPRVLAYSALMAAITAGLAVSLARRVPLELDVFRDRNAAYRETRDGRIENVYRLRVLNMDQRPREFVLRASGPEGIAADYDADHLRLEAGQVRDVPVRLRVPPASLSRRSTEVELELAAADDEHLSVRESTRFLGPRPAARREEDDERHEDRREDDRDESDRSEGGRP
ncbi:MAG: cytochrome c oxidase accessory protein CcoG [Thermoanaerobaculia bacterium]|nr:MAG: cytochrome c oxidase accessory protein CcoG [Thermoanaerobaculia bacterium]